MRLGDRSLKLAAGLGTAAVVAGGALAVAADARPAGAPLKPPVAAGGAGAIAAAGAGSGSLSIPVTPVCRRTGAAPAPRPTPAATAPATSGGVATPAPPGANAGASVPPLSSLDPAVAAAVAQLRTATTPAARRQVLAGLTADQRMQLTAYVAAVQQAARVRAGAGGKGAGAGGKGSTGVASPACRGGAGTGGATGATGTGPAAPGATAIAPDVIAGGSSTPLVVTTVS